VAAHFYLERNREMKKKKLNTIQEKYRKDYEMQSYVDRVQKVRPYVDTETCTVYWGTDSSNHDRGDAN
jgi:hypothetical protein